jgi:hypothetical protein
MDVLVAVAEDYINARAFFSYDISNAAIKKLEISVPVGYDVISVSGMYIKTWNVKDGVLLVELEKEVKGPYSLEAVFESPRESASGQIPLPEPAAIGAAREKGYVAVTAFPLLELALTSKQNSSRIDPSELPETLRGQAGPKVLYSFRFSRHPFSITLTGSLYESAPSLDATIDMVNLVALVTASGKSVIRVIYEVRNNATQYLKVTLPEGAKIWGSFVQDKAVRAALGKDGRVMIPLSSTATAQDNKSFKVELIYYAPTPEWKKKGKLNAIFPKTDLPASEMLVTLYLPSEYGYKDFEGSLKELKTDLARIAPAVTDPAAPDKNKISLRSLGYIGNSKDNINRQMAMEQELKSNMSSYLGELDDKRPADTGRSGGILPVKFNVPQRGSVRRFAQLLVIDEAPGLSFSYKETGKPFPWHYVLAGVKIMIALLTLVLLAYLVLWARSKANMQKLKAGMNGTIIPLP